MKIEYEITKFPENTEKYYVVADTEGDLVISFGDIEFLRTPQLMLVEFAIVLQRWITEVEKNGDSDLYYVSMDEEEEPIFALRYDESENCYYPESCWSKPIRVKIRPDEALSTARKFLDEFKRDILDRYQFDLNVTINKVLDLD